MRYLMRYLMRTGCARHATYHAHIIGLHIMPHALRILYEIPCTYLRANAVRHVISHRIRMRCAMLCIVLSGVICRAGIIKQTVSHKIRTPYGVRISYTFFHEKAWRLLLFYIRIPNPNPLIILTIQFLFLAKIL
jgi:hypothetical protein